MKKKLWNSDRRRTLRQAINHLFDSKKFLENLYYDALSLKEYNEAAELKDSINHIENQRLMLKQTMKVIEGKISFESKKSKEKS